MLLRPSLAGTPPPALLEQADDLEERIRAELPLLQADALAALLPPLKAVLGRPVLAVSQTAEASRRMRQIRAAAFDAAIEDALCVLASGRARAGAFSNVSLDQPLQCVQDWLDRLGASWTAACWSELSAAHHPAEPGPAIDVGRRVRNLAEYDLAEAWFHHGAGLAVAAGDTEMEARAWLGLGTTSRRRGRPRQAREEFRHCYRLAHAGGHDLYAASALHDLGTVETAMGELCRAEKLLIRAMRLYQRVGHPIACLIHDIAYIWMLRGRTYSAFVTFDALLKAPEMLPCVGSAFGNLARAAGEMADRERFEEVWGEILGRSDMDAESWLEAGRGAFALAQYERAETAALRAYELAWANKEARQQVEADLLLEECEAAASADTRSASRPAVSPAGPVPCSRSGDLPLVLGAIAALAAA
jgi:tetratricopeptide (TPR) repeat protein